MNYLQGLEIIGKLFDKFSVDLIYVVYMFVYYYMFYVSIFVLYNLGIIFIGESKIVFQVFGSKFKVEIIFIRLRCDEGFYYVVNICNFLYQNILLSYKIKFIFEFIIYVESLMYFII